MRSTGVTIIVIALSIYAWRDWFRALCGLIVLMALIEHPSVPKAVAGIKGLNPWNLLMASVLCAWWRSRRRENLRWDAPRWATTLLALYAVVNITSFLRLWLNSDQLAGSAFADLSGSYIVSEFFINTFKWIIPGLLVIDGCRSPARKRLMLFSLVALFVLLAVQVALCTRPGALLGSSSLQSGRLRIEKNTGYNAINVATLLACGSWCLMVLIPAVRRLSSRALLAGGAAFVLYAQALTGGRMSYMAWCVTGLAMCGLRWRKGLLLAPLVPALVVVFLPGLAARINQGRDQHGAAGTSESDAYAVTSGRAEVWPLAMEKITESPLIGYGRLAMVRTGIQAALPDLVGEGFSHPHNAYLELLLETGIIGALPVWGLFLGVIVSAARLAVGRSEPWTVAAGSACFAILLTTLVASFGTHHFYPREEAVGLWAAVGLTLRLATDALYPRGASR